MKTHDFYYALPPELIAQTPIQRRDASRLMTLNKETGELGHYHFYDLPQFLKPGDCLVLNDSRVLPARLLGQREPTGGACEVVLLIDRGDNVWECLVRPGKKLRTGAKLSFAHGAMQAELQDGERYQTVYSKEVGSAAAPTAGLHFTEALLEQIQAMGVNLCYVTLHVGLGTFRPVKAEDITDHEMHSEYCMIPAETARIINQTKQNGGRVICVGTTSCRTIESWAAEDGTLQETAGWTNIFIYPGYRFKVLDGLITNFHLPESTLIMLVSALAGREHVLHAYAKAVEEKYRFFSFGDAMLIL